MAGLRPARERVDGILLLDKPKGLGSNDALVRARRLLNALKAGHGGTLDPMASGLLPLMFGEATKFAQDALDADKTYVAELTFGVTTDTGDAEGRTLQRRSVQVDETVLRAACAAFVGGIKQIPPMYSALKRDGKPLYAYARAGIEVERQPRRVTIHSIAVLDCMLDADEPRASIRVHCSKGTYIRTLAADIGERLGCGAHLSALRRESVGQLGLDRAIGLDALEALSLAERRTRLDPPDALLAGLPRVDLDEAAAARFRNGQRLAADAIGAGQAATLDRIAPTALPAEPGVISVVDVSAGAPVAGASAAAAPAAGACVGGMSAPGVLPIRVRVYSDSRLLGLAEWRRRVLAPLRLIALESRGEPVPDAGGSR